MSDLAKMTDRELDAVFATEVAGYTWVQNYNKSCKFLKHPDREFMNHGPAPEEMPLCYQFDREVDKFSTSMDALLPWLEECTYIVTAKTVRGARMHYCKIDNEPVRVSLKTPIRCVAEALIAWKRAQKGQA